MIYNFIVSAILYLILAHAAASRVVVVDETNITLASLCNNVSKNDVIQLNASTVTLSIDCVFDKDNITLKGPGVIKCSCNGSLYFINSSNISLIDVSIINCGAANVTLRRSIGLQLPNPLKKQVIAVLFICCANVAIADVTMTSNLGINLVGINVLGISILDNVTIQNIVQLQGDSTLISSAAVFEFHDISGTCSSQLLSNHSSLNITNSHFLNNNNTLPETVFSYFGTYTVSFESTSDRSIPVLAPGLTVAFIKNNDTYSISVLVSNTIFSKNRGRFGGGLFVAFAIPVKNYSMKVDNCTFQGNTVDKKYIETSYGAAIIAMSVYYNHMHNKNSNSYWAHHSPGLNFLVINNSNFTDNSAVIGTCIYLYLFMNGQSVRVTLENLSFNNNKGDVATAVYAEDHLLYEYLSTVNVNMANIVAENNQRVNATDPALKPLSNVNGLFVFFNIHSVTLHGHSNSFTNNTPGVMGLSGTDIIFDGDFHFVNNSTPNDGGAVYLTAGSTMIIKDNSYIHFKNNSAGKMGGAIYSDSSEGLAVLAAVCPIQFNITENHTHVNFSNNIASHGGNAIFATQLYPCGWFPKFGFLPYNENVRNLYERRFNFSSTYSNEVYNHSNNCTTIPSHDMTNCCFNLSDHDITSAAHSVCFCDHTSPNTCCSNHTVSVIPGKEARFNLMVVDSKNSPLYSDVHFISNHVCNTTKIPVNPNCTEVKVSFCGQPNTTVNVTLRPSTPLYTEGVSLTIHFEDCPVGFQQVNNSCLCDSSLKHQGFCDDNNGLKIPPGAWMDIIDQCLYFKSYCDVTYCMYSSYVIPFNNNTSVCRAKRDGILCGKCIEGYSVVFGSQDCHRCHNYSLVTLIMYAIVGMVVVFLLSFLKLTVDKGIINGVIFYANIVYINHNLLYISHIEALPGIFNLINLDVPTSVCFYQGMTALARCAIEFIFPIYLWLLVFMVILLIKKFPRVSQIIQSPSQLLATLIYLSYSKLLLVISCIVTPIKVSKIQSSEEEDSTVIRWYQDPNVAYLDPWHIVVLIVSLLLFFIFLLPFAVILTFPNYCLGFRCLIHFKPIIDSYTAPYKDKWAFWLGIHLLMLILFYIFSTIQQIYGDPKDLLLIVLLFVIPLAGVQLYCKPYKSKWVNLLDSLFLFNLIMGSCIILWTVKEEGGLNIHKDYFQLVVYFCLAVAVLEILLILLYHVMMVTSSGQLLMMRMYQLLCCKKDAVALDSFSEHSYSPAKLSYSENQPLLDGAQDEPPRFRESFLEYDNLISPRSQS